MIRITNHFLPSQTQTKPPSSRKYPKALSIFLAGCERITKSRYPCLFILIQSLRKWCRYSLLHTLQKEEDQNGIEWVELELERGNMRNENSRSTRRAHSNTDEDHHRQLYENRLFYQLFWHRKKVCCKALEQFSRLYQALWSQCYHECCVHFCKKSLCCELIILRELKFMLGGSIDFDPLKSMVMNHFCLYKQLQDPLVKLDIRAYIDSISKDLDDLLNYFCTLSSQNSPSSEKPTNYGHLSSKFHIDPDYLAKCYKEDEEKSEDEKLEYWQNQLWPDFVINKSQLARIKVGDKIFFVLNTSDMYEEMLKEYDQMYN